jgi:hypothetical protein
VDGQTLNSGRDVDCRVALITRVIVPDVRLDYLVPLISSNNKGRIHLCLLRHHQYECEPSSWEKKLIKESKSRKQRKKEESNREKKERKKKITKKRQKDENNR